MTPEPSKTPEPVKAPDAKVPEPKANDKSLLNAKKPDEAVGAPEKYEPFTLPEGVALDDKVMTDAQVVFKELNLPQAQAQKLVNFHTTQLKAAVDASFNSFQATRETWRGEIVKNPDLGDGTGLRPEVSARIGRAIDMLPNANAFRETMDLTGTGDNPEFVKAFDFFARQLAEGKSVQGGGPTPVAKPGETRSAASALYPNLPSSSRG